MKFIHFVLILCVFIIIIINILFYYYYVKPESNLVFTDSGIIEGTFEYKLGKTVKAYYGIPYAAPPINENRFERPKPLQQWKGIRKATNTLPNACIQELPSRDNLKLDLLPELEPMLHLNFTEDCLYMNIFVPMNNNPNLKTVMVWFHGGSFLHGYMSTPFYDGAALAASGDVIVVIVNYRVGIMGFISAPPLIPGNMGLWDQVMSLEWIQKNIGSFGGDRYNVVIFGQSAGGISAGYHLISSVSHNLFSRAILQSGSAVTPAAMISNDTAVKLMVKIAQMAECPLPPPLIENPNKLIIGKMTINCLKRKSTDDIIQIQNEILRTKRYRAFVPMTDGTFLHQHPYHLVVNQTFGPQKEILIGANSAEGVFFAHAAFGDLWTEEAIPKNFSIETVIEALYSKAPQSGRPYYRMAVEKAYEDIDRNNSEAVWDHTLQLIGDGIYGCPNYVFTKAFVDSGRKAYYYQFMPRPSFEPWTPKWTKGAVHFAETPFIYGRPLTKPQQYTDQERELSTLMMKCWVNFAKYGHPLDDNVWEPYTNEKPQYMALNVGANKMVLGFPGYKCDEYYQMVYEEVLEKGLKAGDWS